MYWKGVDDEDCVEFRERYCARAECCPKPAISYATYQRCAEGEVNAVLPGEMVVRLLVTILKKRW